MAYNVDSSIVETDIIHGVECLLTKNDLKKIFKGMSVDKINKLVKQPDFPKITIGRKIYIPPAALRTWIENYTCKNYTLY
ncbi:MAG: helix-turn-helix domain-containing protein [Anaerostipes sp.]|jgi:hypothetical protein|nr:helix-turn-helix domain-containing protein [Anaerostipes sp.]